MTTYAVSVSEFKAHCLDMIRQVEKAGTAVDLVRHGKVVARLVPTTTAPSGMPAWLRLRGKGALTASAEETVLDEREFEAIHAGQR
ncbi:MAG: type II toxin-antitoxin system Phd/YefM family antitoxin [Rhodocyclaceae bacterium]|nr:MAG: type II toxin-antitoxin system Phd/YefM family antitoxin [Rhodocyclaceae bacterium]